MKVYCSGKYCQEKPEQAKSIEVKDSKDKRLKGVAGYWLCSDCLNFEATK